MPNVRHSTIRVGPANVFNREAGTEGQPVFLLLHGFANSSHYFRHLMPKLASRFHLLAPELPSFGFTTVEEGEGYQFTFAAPPTAYEAVHRVFLTASLLHRR